MNKSYCQKTDAQRTRETFLSLLFVEPLWISQYVVLGAVIRPVQVWKSSYVNMSYITMA